MSKVLFGRYEVVETLGRGELAEVYHVRRVGGNAEFALKLVTESDYPTFASMVQEAELQKRLRHPNIAWIYDVPTDDDDIGLVMEYVKGPTLRQVLQERALDTDDVVKVFVQILGGIGAAHQLGIVHRDLAPKNILINNYKHLVVKIIDFGIATAMGGRRYGEDGTPVGSPGYMAPEQLSEDAQVGPQADIFAIGAMLYEFVCQQAAFRRADPMETLRATVRGVYTPVHELAPHCPDHLATAIERSLRVDPAERFADCAQFTRMILNQPEPEPEAPPEPEPPPPPEQATIDPEPPAKEQAEEGGFFATLGNVFGFKRK